jgi:hypothetical protein
MKTNAARLRASARAVLLLVLAGLSITTARSQVNVEREHRRGKLWEVVRNDGFIGSLGAWDYLVQQPLGMFPGFEGFVHPCCNEFAAVNTYSNANFHNFRGGVWIVSRNNMIPGGPPTYAPEPAETEVYTAGLQDGTYGVSSVLEPLDLRKNYIESTGFNPLLPEEMTDGFWYTNTGIRVTRRSYVWSYPGYSDFIIYDYVFKNTGEYISNVTKRLVPNPDTTLTNQTLRNIYIVFHNGVSVSTKSPIAFHCELFAVAAGGFGWQPASYHDYYHRYDSDELVFSTNYNGGKSPPPWTQSYCVKPNEAWKQRFGDELLSPAAFGWLALYADPLPGQPARSSPRADVLRIDSHKLGQLNGQQLDLESFRGWANNPKARAYTFAVSPDTQTVLGNNGNRMNFYTFSYGPYTLAPGDSVRITLAEIAGVMDYNEVIAGDPNGHFPDSTIAAIRRNAVNARNAVRWGRGAVVNGIPLAADVPEPPPPPSARAINATIGTEHPIIAVTWDKRAETTQFTDGSGTVFYHGLDDLDGYRIYKSTDFQFTVAGESPAFRGAAWTLLKDLPKAEFAQHWDSELGRYRLEDTSVAFGFQYVYYVSAYRRNVASWTSANGTIVHGIPELASGDVNRTRPVAAAPGPISPDDPRYFDIFVVPNPYDPTDPLRNFGNDEKIEFRNMPERASIRIYNIYGDLVWEDEHGPDAEGSLSGTYVWKNLKTKSGIRVASGLYIYYVESKVPGAHRTLTGKLMILQKDR